MDGAERFALAVFMVIVGLIAMKSEELSQRVGALEDTEIQKTKEICIHKVEGE